MIKIQFNVNLDVHIRDIYGWVMDNGVAFVDTDSEYIIRFWRMSDYDDDINVTPIEQSLDVTLRDFLQATNFCEPEDVRKVLTKPTDYTIEA